MKFSASTATVFEQLEPRQLRSVTSPTPEDGNDYHLSLNENSGGVVVSESTEESKRVEASTFQWFDGTPDHGLIANGGTAFQGARCDNYYMWPDIPGVGPDETGGPSEARVRFLARQVVAQGDSVVVFDNEVWGFDIRYHSLDSVNLTIARMKSIISWVRDEEPSLKVGIYGYMSQSDDTASKTWPESQQQIANAHPWYTSSLPEYSTTFARWQATSEYLRPLSESVDYVFPALYTGITDPDEWEKSARATIEDSRRYGKPVIPFIWPNFHDSLGGGLGGTAIPIDFWNRELALVKQYADGAYIWNNRVTQQDDPWLSATIAASEPAGQSRAAAPMMVAASSVSDDASTDDTRSHRLTFNSSPIDDLFSKAA